MQNLVSHNETMYMGTEENILTEERGWIELQNEELDNLRVHFLPETVAMIKYQGIKWTWHATCRTAVDGTSPRCR
jgi:hypothetical protein